MLPTASPADYAGYILDLDGVLWNDKGLLNGARETLIQLKRLGKSFVCVSNNSGRGLEDYQKRIKKFNLPIEIDQVIFSPREAALFIARQKPGARVLVLGSPALKQETNTAGLELVERATDAQFLLTGADQQLTFQKLTEAVRTVLRGVTWIATNPDRLFPGADGLIPGAGAVLSAISYSTQKNPDIMIGKPSPYLFQMALKKLGLPPDRVLVVGDLIEADIEGGKNLGLATALVLTGVSKVDDIERTNIRPDFVLKSVSELVPK